MERALIQKGCFYIGKRQRIREVILDSGWWVDWRDIDPKPLTIVGSRRKRGAALISRSPLGPRGKSSQRKYRPRLAMPKADRLSLSEPHLSKVQLVDQRTRQIVVSAFANCGRALAHVRGSYWPKTGNRATIMAVAQSRPAARSCRTMVRADRKGGTRR
jgi:hypothetical protein